MRITKFIPTIITSIALLLATISFLIIIGKIAVNEPIKVAIVLLLISAMFDVFDGFFARWLQAESQFGAELDTLYDFFALGLVAALIMAACLPNTFSTQFLLVYMIVMSAARLAKFKAYATITPKDYYNGLTMSANFVWIMSFSYLYAIHQIPSDPMLAELMRYIFIAGTITLTILQVSNIHFRKFFKSKLNIVIATVAVIAIPFSNATLGEMLAVAAILLTFFYVTWNVIKFYLLKSSSKFGNLGFGITNKE